MPGAAGPVDITGQCVVQCAAACRRQQNPSSWTFDASGCTADAGNRCRNVWHSCRLHMRNQQQHRVRRLLCRLRRAVLPLTVCHLLGRLWINLERAIDHL